MHKQPLIRKHYGFKDYLHIAMDVLLRRRGPKPLHIPPFAEQETFVSLADPGDWGVLASSISREELYGSLKYHDLRGYGGAGFPVARKLEAAERHADRGMTLIINGVECDPGLLHDAWILEHRKQELVAVISMLQNSLDIRQVYLVHSEGMKNLELDNAVCVSVPDRYPAGEQKHVVRFLLGLELDEREHPSDYGIWVQNVQTILNMYRILSGKPQLRYLTMVDLDSRKSTVVECTDGISVEDLMESVPGFDDRRHVYWGGGFMQASEVQADQLLSANINLIAVGTVPDVHDTPCRNCGQCSRYCPVGIDVQQLVNSKDPMADDVRKSCLSCGVCSYVCPAGKDVCSFVEAS